MRRVAWTGNGQGWAVLHRARAGGLCPVGCGCAIKPTDHTDVDHRDPEMFEPSTDLLSRPVLRALRRARPRRFPGTVQLGLARSCGGFASYYDNPGTAQQLTDRASLSAYVRGRWDLDDLFRVGAAGPYPEGLSFPNANPTVEFTRTFSGASHTGNAKLVCSGGLLVAVVMSSHP